jgi:hypothetical protein
MPDSFAFIDGQNLHLGITDLGSASTWRSTAGAAVHTYILGYLPENQGLYNALQTAGYTLVLRPSRATA